MIFSNIRKKENNLYIYTYYEWNVVPFWKCIENIWENKSIFCTSKPNHKLLCIEWLLSMPLPLYCHFSPSCFTIWAIKIKRRRRSRNCRFYRLCIGVVHHFSCHACNTNDVILFFNIHSLFFLSFFFLYPFTPIRTSNRRISEWVCVLCAENRHATETEMNVFPS